MYQTVHYVHNYVHNYIGRIKTSLFSLSCKFNVTLSYKLDLILNVKEYVICFVRFSKLKFN